jgi:hypothetical protein
MARRPARIEEQYRITTRERFGDGWREEFHVYEGLNPFEALELFLDDALIDDKSDVTYINVEIV